MYPKSLNTDFLKFQIMTLPEEVEIEQRFAKMYGKNLDISYLEATKSYSIDTQIKKEDTIRFITDIDFFKTQNNFSLEVTRKTLTEPMNNDKRDIQKQKNDILDIINTRFLPYRFANKQDCIKSVILHNPDRNYNILVKYGTKEDFTEVLYQYNFSQTKFIEKEYSNERYDEIYW
jgi:hypothetical protein